MRRLRWRRTRKGGGPGEHVVRREETAAQLGEPEGELGMTLGEFREGVAMG